MVLYAAWHVMARHGSVSLAQVVLLFLLCVCIIVNYGLPVHDCALPTLHCPPSCFPLQRSQFLLRISMSWSNWS